MMAVPSVSFGIQKISQKRVGHVCCQPARLPATTRCSHASRALYHKLPLSSRCIAVGTCRLMWEPLDPRNTPSLNGTCFFFRCLGWLFLRSSNRESWNGTHFWRGIKFHADVAGHFEGFLRIIHGTNGNRQGSVVFKLVRTPRNTWQARFQNLWNWRYPRAKIWISSLRS